MLRQSHALRQSLGKLEHETRGPTLFLPREKVESGLSYPLAVCWNRGRGQDKCLHAIHATIYILRDYQSGILSCQCSDSDKTETSPLEILHKNQNIGIWSSPLLPGRIWELGIFPQSWCFGISRWTWLFYRLPTTRGDIKKIDSLHQSDSAYFNLQ